MPSLTIENYVKAIYQISAGQQGLPAAAELAGCDHHTVARYVKLRQTGESPESRTHRVRPIDEFLAKI